METDIGKQFLSILLKSADFDFDCVQKCLMTIKKPQKYLKICIALFQSIANCFEIIVVY